jgi:hypothetical protein
MSAKVRTTRGIYTEELNRVNKEIQAPALKNLQHNRIGYLRDCYFRPRASKALIISPTPSISLVLYNALLSC